ncbi:hypothetical protein ACHAXN_011560 [Cyclotella atomus]
MAATTTPIHEKIRSSLPPLDPNGQPFSMMLRGTLAELGELRSLLMDKSTREQLMQPADDVFEDAEQLDNIGLLAANEEGGTVQTENNIPLMGVEVNNVSSKRRRDGADCDEDEEYSCVSDVTIEDLLVFLPSIQCNCPTWDMKNVQGDLVVTSIRVLFIASTDTNSDDCNDVAIDGRCIALHALDSESSDEEQTNSLSHVYCQLSDPACESNDVAGSTMGFGTSANVMDENASECDDEAEENEEDMSDDNGVIELYFKPIICEHVADKEQHAEVCQKLFDALTKLASLNPVDDSDGGGGGLFNMLSLLAGMEEGMFGGNAESDDDEMVIRFGGSGNNFVEDDDGSDGAPENERQAMLDRLDNILVVPPEYEIPSEEDEGQFDDAEDDEDLL